MLEVPHWGLASGSWFGYGHWFFIHPCFEFGLSMLIFEVQRTFMSFKFWFGALEDAGGSWLGGWHLILDLDMVNGLWCSHVQNFGALHWFWRCKEHPCPSSSDLGLWRMLEVPDLGLGSASSSRFRYGHWSLIHKFSNFSSSILILEFWRYWRFLTRVWHIGLDIDMVTTLWNTHAPNLGSLS